MSERTPRRLHLRFNAPVTLLFFFLCIIVRVVDTMTGGRTSTLFFSVYRSPLSQPLTWIRFFGHVLGHGSWEHLFGNMLMLLVLGPLLEEKYSARSMMLLIAVTALITGVLSWLLTPDAAMRGASGVVFAMILLSSFTQCSAGTIPLTVPLVAALYLAQQISQMLTGSGNIAYLAHLAGGAVGAGMGFALNHSATIRNNTSGA